MKTHINYWHKSWHALQLGVVTVVGEAIASGKPEISDRASPFEGSSLDVLAFVALAPTLHLPVPSPSPCPTLLPFSSCLLSAATDALFSSMALWKLHTKLCRIRVTTGGAGIGGTDTRGEGSVKGNQRSTMKGDEVEMGAGPRKKSSGEIGKHAASETALH